MTRKLNKIRKLQSHANTDTRKSITQNSRTEIIHIKYTNILICLILPLKTKHVDLSCLACLSETDYLPSVLVNVSAT